MGELRRWTLAGNAVRDRWFLYEQFHFLDVGEELRVVPNGLPGGVWAWLNAVYAGWVPSQPPTRYVSVRANFNPL